MRRNSSNGEAAGSVRGRGMRQSRKVCSCDAWVWVCMSVRSPASVRFFLVRRVELFVVGGFGGE